MRNSGCLPDLAHRLVAVHLGHHDVHQHDAQVGRASRISSIAWRPFVALITSMSWFSSTRRQREDVARVVVHDEHLAAARARRSSRAAARASAACRPGRSATTRCRNSAVSSNSRSGDCTSLSTMLLATSFSRASSSADSSLPVKTTTGTSRSVGVGLHPLEQLEAAHVRQPQIDDAAVERLAVEQRAAPRRRCRPRRSRCRRAPAARRCSRARCRCPRRRAAASCAA